MVLKMNIDWYVRKFKEQMLCQCGHSRDYHNSNDRYEYDEYYDGDDKKDNDYDEYSNYNYDEYNTEMCDDCDCKQFTGLNNLQFIELMNKLKHDIDK